MLYLQVTIVSTMQLIGVPINFLSNKVASTDVMDMIVFPAGCFDPGSQEFLKAVSTEITSFISHP